MTTEEELQAQTFVAVRVVRVKEMRQTVETAVVPIVARDANVKTFDGGPNALIVELRPRLVERPVGEENLTDLIGRMSIGRSTTSSQVEFRRSEKHFLHRRFFVETRGERFLLHFEKKIFQFFQLIDGEVRRFFLMPIEKFQRRGVNPVEHLRRDGGKRSEDETVVTSTA